MSLAVNGKIVVELAVQHVALQQRLGAFELEFGLAGKVNPQGLTEPSLWIVLHGADVLVRTESSAAELLGVARPRQPHLIRQYDFMSDVRLAIGLRLDSAQLAKLEDLRNGADLQFEVRLFGAGGQQEDWRNEQAVQDTVHKTLGRSDWADRLRQAGALNILLLEIPMPMTGASATQKQVAAHLQAAQRCFLDARYRACVEECRHAFDALGVSPDGRRQEKMDRTASKEEREQAFLLAIRKYTDLAHHVSETSVTVEFERHDAALVLQLTAACSRHIGHPAA